MTTSTDQPNTIIEKTIPRWKYALLWVAAGVLAVPVACLLHELGHHVFALVFRFQGATLHYFSANYAMEEKILNFMSQGNRTSISAIYPLWQIAVNAIAGPAVGYFLILPVCLLVVKFTPYSIFIALGTIPLIRAIPETLFALFSPQMLDDENTAAFALGLPPTVLQVIGLLISLLGAIWLSRHIPKGRRRLALMSMGSGIVAGLIVYLAFLGPWLLP
jgi:ABC-type phosphate/phosphonate transport system permease subunit